MLTNAPVAPTLPVVDMERAKQFYTEKLGLKLSSAQDDVGGMMFDCGEGTKLFLYQRGQTKADNTAASFKVDNVEAEVAELRGKGVVFEEYDFPGLKTENGIATIGKTKGAWFKDTEGNILAVTEMMS